MTGWPCVLSVLPGPPESQCPHMENQANHIHIRSSSEIAKVETFAWAWHLDVITVCVSPPGFAQPKDNLVTIGCLICIQSKDFFVFCALGTQKSDGFTHS